MYANYRARPLSVSPRRNRAYDQRVPMPHVLEAKPFRVKRSDAELTEPEAPTLSYGCHNSGQYAREAGVYPEVLLRKPFKTKKSDKRPTRTIPFAFETAYGPPPVEMPATEDGEDMAPTAAPGIILREQPEIEVSTVNGHLHDRSQDFLSCPRIGRPKLPGWSRSWAIATAVGSRARLRQALHTTSCRLSRGTCLC